MIYLNHATKALIYGMIAFLILGGSGESLGSGKGSFMDFKIFKNNKKNIQTHISDLEESLLPKETIEVEKKLEEKKNKLKKAENFKAQLKKNCKKLKGMDDATDPSSEGMMWCGGEPEDETI